MNDQNKAVMDAMGEIREKYSADWLDEANKVFINELNYLCRNYKGVFSDIKQLKTKVLEQHQTDIADLQFKINELQDTVTYQKTKVDSLEQNMSTVVREIINYTFDQRVEPRIASFVSQEELRKGLKYKLDKMDFNEYLKGSKSSDGADSKWFKVDQKLQWLTRQFQALQDGDRGLIADPGSGISSPKSKGNLQEVVNDLKKV